MSTLTRIQANRRHARHSTGHRAPASAQTAKLPNEPISRSNPKKINCLRPFERTHFTPLITCYFTRLPAIYTALNHGGFPGGSRVGDLSPVAESEAFRRGRTAPSSWTRGKKTIRSTRMPRPSFLDRGTGIFDGAFRAYRPWRLWRPATGTHVPDARARARKLALARVLIRRNSLSVKHASRQTTSAGSPCT